MTNILEIVNSNQQNVTSRMDSNKSTRTEKGVLRENHRLSIMQMLIKECVRPIFKELLYDYI